MALAPMCPERPHCWHQALRVAADLGDRFPEGVYQVSDTTSPVAVTNLNSLFPGFPSVFCPDGSRPRGVQFDVNQTGGTYYIQVDGANASGPAPTGSVTLNWSKP